MTTHADTVERLTGTPAEQLATWVQRTGTPPRIAMETITRRHRGHFFDPRTMRLFGSRLGAGGYALPNGGAVFVTSEQVPSFEHFASGTGPYYSPRRYSVRVQSPEGDIAMTPYSLDPETRAVVELPGLEYGEHETRESADKAARAFCLRSWLAPDEWADAACAGRARGWPPSLIAAGLGITYQKVTALLEQED